MHLLLGTVLLRPYVFLFLTVYLLGYSLQFGIRPALLFLPVGYLLAFLSELSSIHLGFPYGDYSYIPTTDGLELWVLGVPFMDSLSYVFLAACSYATAVFLLSPFVRDGGRLRLYDTQTCRGDWAAWILGSILMVLLDIIIDPVALRGDQWFLGKIYEYTMPGRYFGVPLSNFGGWLVVALILVKVLQEITTRRGRNSDHFRFGRTPLISLWGPFLYLGILGFNLGITIAIGETALFYAGLFPAGVFLFLSAALTLYKARYPLR